MAALYGGISVIFCKVSEREFRLFFSSSKITVRSSISRADVGFDRPTRDMRETTHPVGSRHAWALAGGNLHEGVLFSPLLYYPSLSRPWVQIVANLPSFRLENMN
jgi:hypothetical protein